MLTCGRKEPPPSTHAFNTSWDIATHWDRIRTIDPTRFSERFRRAWLFYLGGAAETFEAAREIINCYHITFIKGHFTGAAPG
jgi:hypothetical protein